MAKIPNSNDAAKVKVTVQRPEHSRGYTPGGGKAVVRGTSVKVSSGQPVKKQRNY